MYQVNFLPKGSKVYIHTDKFGDNKLVAGKVLCTLMRMTEGHPCFIFVKTGLGIVKIARNCTYYIYGNLNASADSPNKSSCGVFASVEDFRTGKQIELLKSEVLVDVYGLVHNDSTSSRYGDFTIHGYYLSGSHVQSNKIYLHYMLHDEQNSRLIPAHYVSDFRGVPEPDIEQTLTTPKTKQEILTEIGSRHSDVVFETIAAAEKSLTDNVKIVELDGEVFVEEPKEPTIKEKLQEFIDQQCTSLEMIRTIVDEMQ